MLLDTIFAPFVKERPSCVMARAALERLLDAPRVDALFARTAQHQYTREIIFSSRVRDPTSWEMMRVRRMTLKLTVPTRDEDPEFHILSNVPSATFRP
jgi:hypothetical protein